MRLLLRPSLLHHHPRRPIPSSPPRRLFLSTAPTLTNLTATRTLPHPPTPLFSLVADIPSYPLFLPHLTTSRVTAWSNPDPLHSRRWPAAAELAVGFAGLEERLWSRVYCAPDRVVESVAGGARTRLGGKEVAHYEGLEVQVPAEGEEGGLMRYLVSRWTLEPVTGGRETEVRLDIEFEFASAMYAQLGRAAAPAVAEVMIKAFERRVEKVLGKKEGI